MLCVENMRSMDKNLEKVGVKTRQRIYDFLIQFFRGKWICIKRKRNMLGDKSYIKETFWQKDDEIDLTSESRILSDGKLLPKTPKPQVIRENFGSVEVVGEEKSIQKISILRKLLRKEG